MVRTDCPHILAATYSAGRAPLLLTTRLANLLLGHFLPENRTHIGSASLSLTGTLILRDVVMIFDFSVRSRHPLATAREIDARFARKELFARKLGRIQADDVTVYARSDDHSQLSLVDLAYELWRRQPVRAPRQSGSARPKFTAESTKSS